MNKFENGSYYWARHHDGTYFVVKFEDNLWYMIAAYWPINQNFKPETQIICKIEFPLN